MEKSLRFFRRKDEMTRIEKWHRTVIYAVGHSNLGRSQTSPTFSLWVEKEAINIHCVSTFSSHYCTSRTVAIVFGEKRDQFLFQLIFEIYNKFNIKFSSCTRVDNICETGRYIFFHVLFSKCCTHQIFISVERGWLTERASLGGWFFVTNAGINCTAERLESPRCAPSFLSAMHNETIWMLNMPMMRGIQ